MRTSSVKTALVTTSNLNYATLILISLHRAFNIKLTLYLATICHMYLYFNVPLEGHLRQAWLSCLNFVIFFILFIQLLQKSLIQPCCSEAGSHCFKWNYLVYKGPSWSWSHGSWIYNWQCISPLILWVWTLFMTRCTQKTLYDKVCQWHATSQWFPPSIKLTGTI